jgi:ubiquinone/menaquinone biosynthesis C-methylase UbiE
MYVFDNAAPQAAARLAALAAVFDPGSRRHLCERGVADGWRCLEIGGGLGTMTRWLSERVGPAGAVLTTDIDTRHLQQLRLANVDVRQHDVLTDPLPTGSFDLAMARLVLEHLPDPDVALAKMIDAVRPGGWLVVEDFELLPGVATEEHGIAERISKTMAAMRHVSAAAGAHRRLGRSLASRLRLQGLANVDTEGRVLLWRGGTTGATLSRLNFEQLREPILATGLVTLAEFEADVAALDSDSYEARSPVLWTAWGQKP